MTPSAIANVTAHLVQLKHPIYIIIPATATSKDEDIASDSA